MFIFTENINKNLDKLVHHFIKEKYKFTQWVIAPFQFTP